MTIFNSVKRVACCLHLFTGKRFLSECGRIFGIVQHKAVNVNFLRALQRMFHYFNKMALLKSSLLDILNLYCVCGYIQANKNKNKCGSCEKAWLAEELYRIPSLFTCQHDPLVLVKSPSKKVTENIKSVEGTMQSYVKMS